jgi:hypothetical protein
MLLPGAKNLTQVPKLEKELRKSSSLVHATVTTPSVPAGEPRQQSRPSLPAATKKVMPALMALLIALSKLLEDVQTCTYVDLPMTSLRGYSPFAPRRGPNDMLMTAGF